MVLVHSPLVGPFTWSLVAQQLQAGGFDVLVPTLTDSGETPPPYWQLPDGRVRQQVLAQMQPRSLSFFEEVMPDVPGWPDAPGGYRHFLEQAQSAGWPSRTLHAGHFYMLVDPIAVAAALVELMKQVDEKLSR